MHGTLRRRFGATGLEVSAVGLGAGHIGDPAMSEQEVAALLGSALDAGVTLFDTARSYGESEARLGRHLRHRRTEIVLSTKVGYGVAGHEDWTAACVGRGIEEALARLGTDYLDLVHLHSCPRAVLERGEVVEALVAAVTAGKVRVAAYSGDNDDLAYAIGCGSFGAVQTSVSVVDPWSARELVPRAARAGLGIIAKRPLGNAPWRFADPPAAPDLGEYWRRWRALGLALPAEEIAAVALRYTLFHTGADCALVGTGRVQHLRAALRACAQGPLDPDRRALIDAALTRCAAGWAGVV
ncbi:MAG TPA: aldo/keto reductase [Kofleriaceae bacterium]|nr:aldo/keto reductase [Kofleriaceae bacterium]